MDRAEPRDPDIYQRPSRRRTRRTRAAPMVMRCAHHNAEPELMLQSEILDAGTLCVASDGGQGTKVRRGRGGRRQFHR